MKAIVNTSYGSPDVMQYMDIARPTPDENQVLVKVQTASVNALDWHILRADPIFVRSSEGFLKPRNHIRGADVAGRVEAIGANVTQFKVGDEVFGGCDAGGFAEYVAVRENALVLKPSSMTFEQAASVPVAALTALQALRKGQIKAGQKVLINGASGGVGTFAVQLAKSFGTEVTAVCSTSKVEMVRSLGADHVIDYTKEKFAKNGQRYDLIFDNVGNIWVSDYQRLLTPEGLGVIVGFTGLTHLLHTLLVGSLVFRNGKNNVSSILANINQPDLAEVKELIEAGKVTPMIDRCYPLAETAEAMRYIETGRARGKIIIVVGNPNQ